ncbi:trypsin-like peptidase domain-containing protein [Porifericola rhodea]|uniref:trypsin-like peptidase domain-containing protein n=1 Tax=Porifericola rhodea TaxID=930972 RepID=UPI002665DCD9|nr:trypsin-like peptidase domain-containing protein [Porifericola rhodea]WKN29960.1 trypsin-like peptidase domain-containing protein [Porifericola rhodea]
MNKLQFFLGVVLAAILGGVTAVSLMQYFDEDSTANTNLQSERNIQLSKYLTDTAFTVPDGINFIYAAERVKPGVVFIRSTYNGSGQSFTNPLEDLYNEYFRNGEPRERRGPSRSSGSGVIISEDGYIVTNNHVIEDADKVDVTLDDNRMYTANVIGVDPTTDLALIKIDEEDLPFVDFGDSDDLKIGEWVLAVGNPFGTLTSTVTAGIISAKARNINILHDRNNRQIEAFIQTDAAVNQGNSGGALVNLRGELIGINTAIATFTGTYAGYSFAVPATLVRKVMNDLIEFGTVQRALLGVSIINVDARLAAEEGLDIVEGVYIQGVASESAASEAGIQPGDIIVEINGKKVTNVSELQELVARNRPGDKVKVTYYRDGGINNVYATLKNTMGDTEVVKRPEELEMEGALFITPTADVLQALEIEGGAQVVELGEGKWADAGLEEGFVITSIDHEKVFSAEQLMDIMADKSGGILIEGITSEGKHAFYGYGW